MSSCLQNFQLACAVCRIALHSLCHGRKNMQEEMVSFEAVCIGLTGAGKTTLLCSLSRQSEDEIVPTTGFMIKACQMDNCILNLKEIGGSVEMRQYWKHYYKACRAVVFVFDSASSTEDLEVAVEALRGALKHPDLTGVPCLVIANCQDKPGARSHEQLLELLHLENICFGRQWALSLCSKDNYDSIYTTFSKLALFLKPPVNI